MPSCAECKAAIWTERTYLEKCLIVSLIFTGAYALAISSAYLAAVLINKEKKDAKEMKALGDNECQTRSCIYAAETILENMDSSVSPCEDFYNFACGNFFKRTIPVDKVKITTLSFLDDKVQEQMKNVLEEPLQKGEPKVFQLMKKFYKTCMDTDRIENNGLNTIRSILKDLGGWPLLEGDNWTESKFDWKELSYKFQKMGFYKNPLFQVYVIHDLKNSSRRAICLADEEGSVQITFHKRHWDTLRAYYQFIEDAAVLLGADKIKARNEINDTFDMQRLLWSYSFNSQDDTTEEFTVKQLQQKFPNIAWVDYINNLLAPHVKITGDDTVYVMRSTYLTNLDSLVPFFAKHKRMVANFMMWKFVRFTTPYSIKALRDSQLQYREAFVGVASQGARWVNCVENLMIFKDDSSVESESLYIGGSALLVRKYFNKTKTKQDAHEMFSNIHHSLEDTMKNIDWMDAKTKKNALDKAKAMIINTAYPDELLDDKILDEFYGNLTLDENDYLKTILTLNRFDTWNRYKDFRKPVERNHWTARAMVNLANAFYNPQQNSINIPAAMLQGYAFDSDRPQYLNYGVVGAVIGHEFTHGFDTFGSKRDKVGNKVDWWSPQSRKTFLQKAQCFVEQYNKYVVPDINMTVNGNLTVGENIADNGGIAVSYKAYQDWIKKHGAGQTLPGLKYTQNQLFWIAAGNFYCSKSTVHYQKNLMFEDVHSPDQFRVIGTLSNNKDFSKDFSCSLGSNMNPKNKCKLW